MAPVLSLWESEDSIFIQSLLSSQVGEFDSPANLLANPDSKLSAMLEAAGDKTAQGQQSTMIHQDNRTHFDAVWM